ncbi:MAG TPA: sigma-70 family RNA polymerase sigma factor [Abditibacteriaceae bacterium]|nr:sigma-70 family RNA polymerase sigma factor [Abditibacteriaceae bacterium]
MTFFSYSKAAASTGQKPPPQTRRDKDSDTDVTDALALADGSTLAGADDVVPNGSPAPSVPVHETARFEEIVERYHGKVFQLVYRYTGDYEESCDLTQDTFVRAYNAWNEFRGEAQVYTWLYRIAINLCHNQQKKLQRRHRVERGSLDANWNAPAGDEESGSWHVHEVADERPLPLQVIESCELRERLHQALAELPENYRTVIVLRDIEGLSYEEIASITDSTLEAIKSRLFRARHALRRLLTPYLGGPLPDAPAQEGSTQAALAGQNRPNASAAKPLASKLSK